MKSLFLLLIFSFSFTSFGQVSQPSLSELEEGWNSIDTQGLCSSGTPFNFYAKDSQGSDNLLLYFNGGGACWFGEACDLNSEPNLHFPFADMPQNNPSNMGGIFDEARMENPFRDFDMVVIPYCTGDLHIGGGEQQYQYTNLEGQRVSTTAYHNGFTNSSEVLSWVYENYPNAEKVVLAGSSAGAVGASFYSGLVAQNYADVDVYLIGDAAGGYGTPLLPKTHAAWQTDSILPSWSGYEDKDNSNLTFEDYYSISANHSSNLTIAQFNTAEDQTQKMFTQVIGDPVGSFSLPQRILNNYLRIESEVDEFYSYMAGGSVHTILLDDIFYEYEVEDVRFVQWVEELISGEKPRDISCVREAMGCAEAPGSNTN